ncbi:MAG: DUF1294 domain-containing protein [Clostridia bacterium]|nr:DUF1294 domain-containing protein [Clostridia bacterium]
MKLEIIFLFWNIFVMLVFGMDKLLARMKKWRISEQVLLLLAFLFGGIGALFGMVLFNHKTRKTKFRFGVPVIVVFNALTAFLLFQYFG